jgi:hypothetical protein
MSLRAIKLLAFTMCGIIALLLAGVSAGLIMDYMQYQKVEITSALLRDGQYDPSLHFTFDRACVFPPESVLANTWLSQKGYRHVDPIFPDTYTNWTLVLIDDKKKTFRTLYVLEPKVKFGGQIACSPKMKLETAATDGRISAYVKQPNEH